MIRIIASLTFCVAVSACDSARQPVPVPPPVVTSAPEPERTTVPLASRGPLEQRGDFRSFHCGSEFYLIGEQEFPRADCLADYRDHGYTDAWVTVTRDRGLTGIAPFDYLNDVHRYRAIAIRFREAGIRVHPVIGCEDAEELCRRNHGAFPAWLDRIAAFVAGVDDVATSYVIGVEIREWATWDQAHDIVERIAAASDRPIILHFNQGQWGPSSADPLAGRRAIRLLAPGPRSRRQQPRRRGAPV